MPVVCSRPGEKRRTPQHPGLGLAVFRYTDDWAVHPPLRYLPCAEFSREDRLLTKTQKRKMLHFLCDIPPNALPARDRKQEVPAKIKEAMGGEALAL